MQAPISRRLRRPQRAVAMSTSSTARRCGSPTDAVGIPLSFWPGPIPRRARLTRE
jgi:hypothetical protein